MSVSFSFLIETDLQPQEALKELIAGIDCHSEIESYQNRNGKTIYHVLHKPFFRASAYSDDDRNMPEELGIHTNTVIGFKPFFDSSTDVEAELMRTAIAWLHGHDGDALFQLDGADPHFIRRDGKVLVSSDPDLWTPSTLAEITLPHEKTLTF